MLVDTTANFNDYMLDSIAFEMWQAEQNKETEDSVLIKRKKRLCKIVKKVIENELDGLDRLLAKLYWYSGLNQTQIATMLGLHKSFVSRHIKKANETIYKNLKYVMEYCYGFEFKKEGAEE